jgi:hypothetical protein
MVQGTQCESNHIPPPHPSTVKQKRIISRKNRSTVEGKEVCSQLTEGSRSNAALASMRLYNQRIRIRRIVGIVNVVRIIRGGIKNALGGCVVCVVCVLCIGGIGVRDLLGCEGLVVIITDEAWV